jgi:NTP pyrophosphatase (non-canonical NTP hydrolase)
MTTLYPDFEVEYNSIYYIGTPTETGKEKLLDLSLLKEWCDDTDKLLEDKGFKESRKSKLPSEKALLLIGEVMEIFDAFKKHGPSSTSKIGEEVAGSIIRALNFFSDIERGMNNQDVKVVASYLSEICKIDPLYTTNIIGMVTHISNSGHSLQSTYRVLAGCIYIGVQHGVNIKKAIEKEMEKNQKRPRLYNTVEGGGDDSATR